MFKNPNLDVPGSPPGCSGYSWHQDVARTAKRTASCPHQITIQPQTARQDGRRQLACRAAIYYRLRQRSPVPVGVILQPLSPMTTPASLGSALPLSLSIL